MISLFFFVLQLQQNMIFVPVPASKALCRKPSKSKICNSSYLHWNSRQYNNSFNRKRDDNKVGETRRGVRKKTECPYNFMRAKRSVELNNRETEIKQIIYAPFKWWKKGHANITGASHVFQEYLILRYRYYFSRAPARAESSKALVNTIVRNKILSRVGIYLKNITVLIRLSSTIQCLHHI